MTRLIQLPRELLLQLPFHIRNIEDFNAAASSCRTLRYVFAETSPNAILRLAAASSPTFFSPHPEFLVMASARRVRDWAIGNPERVQKLEKSFQGGMEGLLDLCLDVGGLTMPEIRKLHLARFDIINPLADIIDKMAGVQWYETPNFWNGGVSEPYTISTNPDRATFQLIIYGELFGSTLMANIASLDPKGPTANTHQVTFSRSTRIEFIKYCVPDEVCQKGYTGFAPPLPVGPYDPKRTDDLLQDQVALRYILRCGRWQRLWEKVLDQIVPKFDEDWRQKLWWDSIQLTGLEALEVVTKWDREEGLPQSWVTRLSQLHDEVTAVPSEDAVSDAPNLRDELYYCCAGMWKS